MRWQTTAVLAVLLAVLGGFYYVYEVRLGPEREKTEARKGRVFRAEPADVDGGRAQAPDEPVRPQARGRRLADPRAGEGARRPRAVDETLTIGGHRQDGPRDRRQPRRSRSPTSASTSPPAEITLTLKDGKQLGLLLGAKSPTGVWVYAREADKPAVFVVGESVLRDATRPVADFRDKTVLAFDRKDVTGFEIVTRDETLAVERADAIAGG